VNRVWMPSASKRIAGHNSIAELQRYIHPTLTQWSALASGFHCMARDWKSRRTTATRYSIRYTDAGGCRKTH
jgi:hypothetical protein